MSIEVGQLYLEDIKLSSQEGEPNIWLSPRIDFLSEIGNFCPSCGSELKIRDARPKPEPTQPPKQAPVQAPEVKKSSFVPCGKCSGTGKLGGDPMSASMCSKCMGKGKIMVVPEVRIKDD